MKATIYRSIFPKLAAGLLVLLSCVLLLGVAQGESGEPATVSGPSAAGLSEAHSPASLASVGGGFDVPSKPASSALWRTRVAYPNLNFDMPMMVVDAGDSLMVLENRGKVWRFSKDRQTSEKTLVLDVSPNMSTAWPLTDGAQGLCLHPEFGQAGSPFRGTFFVQYPGYDGERHYARLSRFDLPDGRDSVDLSTEQVLIDQVDNFPDQHLGGGLCFGPDGYLYVSVGDQGGRPDGRLEAQTILAEKGMFAGVLRLDIARIGGDVSFEPRNIAPTAEVSGYYIPRDNPFVGAEPGALEEYYAIGLRNPFRMSFDRETGELWVGDVGNHEHEEVNYVRPGDNFGWSYLEGTHVHKGSPLRGRKPQKYYGTERMPVHEYPHVDNNRCVIGGYVYRGSKLPGLRGKYIFGDNLSGRIWAMEHKDGQKVGVEELVFVQNLFSSGLLGFGELNDGELLLCEGGTPGESTGRLLELEPVAEDQQAATRFAPTLSATGLFKDVATLTPSDRLFHYQVNSPLWSDYAAKQRWFVLPEGEKITFSETGDWRFPVGTIFVKHFELPVDERDPEKVHRLETRLIVQGEPGDGVFAATYRWNEEQTEAFLLPDGHSEMIEKYDASGNKTTQKWVYPSRNDCSHCHNRNSGFVLGVNTRQLNGPSALNSGRTEGENQVVALDRLGMFDRALSAEKIAAFDKLVALNTPGTSLAEQGRSFMDANCSHCHRPGGILPNKVDGRFSAVWEPGQDTVERRKRAIKRISMPEMKDENSQNRMPLIGSLELNHEAIGVMKRWHLSEVPATVHAAIYMMCLCVAVALLLLGWRATGSLWAGVLLGLVGVAWMFAAELLSHGGLFEMRFNKFWLDWLVLGGIVVLGTLLLVLPGYRRAIARTPQWVLIAPHALRLTALVLVPLAGLSFVEASYTKAVYTEASIAVAAVLLALVIGYCGNGWGGRLLAIAWNVIGLIGLAYMAKSIVTPSEWIMHRAPLVLYALAGMPLVALLHVYSIATALFAKAPVEDAQGEKGEDAASAGAAASA